MLTDQAIDDACAQAGIGRRTLESRQRDPDTVRRREIVAWLLHGAHGWTQKEIGLALHANRWTGADLATDALGILEGCHRLLSSTYLRFAARWEQGARADRLIRAASGASKVVMLATGLRAADIFGDEPEQP